MNEPVWTYLCATSELLPGQMRSTFDEVTGAPIIVFNLGGTLYALEDRCSHQDFGLATGHFEVVDGSIQCALHGARFDVRDGRPLCAPAYAPVAAFPVKVEHGSIWSRDDRD